MDYLQGNYAPAERSYRRAAELDPGSPEAHHGLCIALVRLGRCQEAASACARCLELRPEEARCRKSLAGARACLDEDATLPSPSRSPPGPGSP